MGERSILSYFPSSRQANQAKQALVQLGYDVVQVDRISRYPEARLDEQGYNPLAAQIASQSNLVLDTAWPDDAALLASSDPSVSGMSGDGVPGKYPFILTVVTDNEAVEQAVEVIKKYGGSV